MATKLHCDECDKVIAPNEYRISMVERDNERRYDIKELNTFCSKSCAEVWFNRSFVRDGK